MPTNKEPEVGFTCMRSAQTPSLILVLYDDDDNCDDCDHDNGHLQKNLHIVDDDDDDCDDDDGQL